MDINEYARIKFRQRRARDMRFIHRYKILMGCTDCGEHFPDNPEVFDLDHVTGEKFLAVSQLVGKASRKRLKAEIRKCQVRCANCHRIRHANVL